MMSDDSFWIQVKVRYKLSALVRVECSLGTIRGGIAYGYIRTLLSVFEFVNGP
jgi:hypothetical protein